MPRSSLALASLLLLLAAGCAGGNAEPPAPAVPELEAHLAALGWSQDQLKNLDPDDPPEQRTPIRLERWERGDPSRTTSPESFDVVARVANRGGEANLYVDVLERWGIGPLPGDAPTEWTEWQPHTRFGPLPTDVTKPSEIRLATIDLASRQAALFAEDRWPFVYEARVVVVRGVSSDVAVAEVDLRLPIQTEAR